MFSQTLKELRRSHKLTQAQLADILGLERSSIGKYETSTVLPSLDMGLKIAKYFGVSVDYLLGAEEKDTEHIDLTSDEKALIKAYSNLNSIGKERLNEYIEMLASQEKYTQDTTAKAV